jgi:hypothetical protein
LSEANLILPSRVARSFYSTTVLFSELELVREDPVNVLGLRLSTETVNESEQRDLDI